MGGRLESCRPSLLPAVIRIHRACFPHPYPVWRFIGFQLSGAANIDVVTVSGEVVGYLIAHLNPTLRAPRLVAEVISVAVLPAHRNRGLGRRLLESAERWATARGAAEIYLQVALDNVDAQRLYERLGYEREQKLYGYYVNGDDAWQMRHRLPPLDEPT